MPQQRTQEFWLRPPIEREQVPVVANENFIRRRLDAHAHASNVVECRADMSLDDFEPGVGVGIGQRPNGIDRTMGQKAAFNAEQSGRRADQPRRPAVAERREDRLHRGDLPIQALRGHARTGGGFGRGSSGRSRERRSITVDTIEAAAAARPGSFFCGHHNHRQHGGREKFRVAEIVNALQARTECGAWHAMPLRT